MVKENKLSASSRQLKVGESLRRALIEAMSQDLYDPVLEKVALTVSEVKMTPDLKLAIAYVSPLFGRGVQQDELLVHLKTLAPKLRYLVANKVDLRYAPEIQFKFDQSFDEAAKIEILLTK
jgi:ribosome-binding factor A